MRHKTIRAAVAGAMLVTFVFVASPATAGTTRPSSQRGSAASSAVHQVGEWVLSWAGAFFAARDRSAGAGDRTKATSSNPDPAPARTVESSQGSTDAGAHIDPMGLQ